MTAKRIGEWDFKATSLPIVPTRAMLLIERACADAEDENIAIAVRDNDILVRTPRTTLYARLVEGRFPAWRQVLPNSEGMTPVGLSVGPLYSAVRQAAIVTDENHRGVDFTFEGDRLILAGLGAETGESRVELPIAESPLRMSVTLDPRFLSEFLKVLDPDSTVTLYLKDAQSAVLAIVADGYRYVIMPLAKE